MTNAEPQPGDLVKHLNRGVVWESHVSEDVEHLGAPIKRHGRIHLTADGGKAHWADPDRMRWADDYDYWDYNLFEGYINDAH